MWGSMFLNVFEQEEPIMGSINSTGDRVDGVCVCKLARVEPRGLLTRDINLTWAHIHMLQYKCKHTHTSSLGSLQQAEVPTSNFLITSALITQAILNTSHDLLYHTSTSRAASLTNPTPLCTTKQEPNIYREEGRQHCWVSLCSLHFHFLPFGFFACCRLIIMSLLSHYR